MRGPFDSESVSLSAWFALVGLVESRAFCASQALASCVHACMPQLKLRALHARRVRGYVEKQKDTVGREKQIPSSSYLQNS